MESSRWPVTALPSGGGLLLAVLICALCGCWRTGYEEPSPTEGSGPGSASADGGSAADGSSESVPLECSSEQLLTSLTHTFDASLGPAPEVLLLALTLGLENSSDRIGQDMGYSDGYSGIQDFRPAEVPYFADIVVPLMDGRETDLWRGLEVYPDGSGGRSPVTLSPSVAGSTVTLARQRVESLILGVKMSNGAMKAEGTVVWELWGCP